MSFNKASIVKRLRRREGKNNDQLCKLIREAILDRPDLNPRNKLRLARTEMLAGKPVQCYIEI